MAAAKKREKDAMAEVQAAEPQFGKGQIAASERYHSQRDLVDALLEKDKKYTIAAVDSLIRKYKEGKVK